MIAMGSGSIELGRVSPYTPELAAKILAVHIRTPTSLSPQRVASTFRMAGIKITDRLQTALEKRVRLEMAESSAEMFEAMGMPGSVDTFIKIAIEETLDIRNRVAKCWFFRARRLRQVDEHLAKLVAWRLRLNK